MLVVARAVGVESLGRAESHVAESFSRRATSLMTAEGDV